MVSRVTSRLRSIGVNEHAILVSAWKSGLKTGKKPDQDRNWTNQDRKFPGLQKTKTAVWSSVLHNPGNSKTDKNRLRPVLTGCMDPRLRRYKAILGNVLNINNINY